MMVLHGAPSCFARDELPHDAARAEPEPTGLATRQDARFQQVIHLPKLFVVFLLRQLAEKLDDIRLDAEECVTLFVLVVHSLFCLRMMLVETKKLKSKPLSVRMDGVLHSRNVPNRDGGEEPTRRRACSLRRTRLLRPHTAAP